MGDVVRFPDGYIAAREFGWIVVLKNRRRRIYWSKEDLISFVEETLRKMGVLRADEKLAIVKRSYKRRIIYEEEYVSEQISKASRLYGIKRR